MGLFFSVDRGGCARERSRMARHLRPRLQLAATAAVGFAVASELGRLVIARDGRPQTASNLLLAGAGCLTLAAVRWPPLGRRPAQIATAAGIAFAAAIGLRFAGPPAGAPGVAAEAAVLLIALAALVPLGWRRHVVFAAVALVAAAAAGAASGAAAATLAGALAGVAAAGVAAAAIARLVERVDSHLSIRLDRLRGLARRSAGAVAPDQRVAHLSHDLRNPLAVAFGYAEMAGDDELAQEERTRALWRVKRSLWELTQMVENVLESSAEEAGALVLAAEPLEASALCEELCASVAILARGKPVRIHALAEPGLLVLADRQRLVRVLSNLVGNALKYTERGSVTLHATRSGDRVVFEVADTGPGIEPDKLTQIFEQYSQLPGPRRGGVGLGLAIARLLTERMGGSLAVASTPGAGSRFTISLPIAAAAERRGAFAAA